jgi:hypothetical protein
MAGEESELQSVRLASPISRTLAKDVAYTEEVVVTAKGSVTVAWKGDRTKPAMLTYHDLGLNHVSNFQVGSIVRRVKFSGIVGSVKNLCLGIDP